MPTYQYSCTECGHFLEKFQSFSEDSLTVCPECEGRLRKVFNAVGVVFKGSGFYRTDSRASGGDGAKATSEATTTSAPASGSSNTGDSSGSGSTTSDTSKSKGPSTSSGSAA